MSLPGSKRLMQGTRCFLIGVPIASMVLAQEPEIEIQSLREQLTEREDENRVEEPWPVQFLDRTLLMNGQYEVSVETIDRIPLDGDSTNNFGQILLEQEVEIEGFYAISPLLSAFVQLRLQQEKDLDSGTVDDVSDIYFGRGEMWLYAETVGGLPLHVEVGRLDFEDDRLWWWDQDLDAVRVEYERETFDMAMAAAQELAPTRSDRSHVEPEENQIFRWIVEASLDLIANHELTLFGLYHKDRSRTESPGEFVPLELDDPSDAELTWIGFRASGAVALDYGLFGYWADIAHVQGRERLIETDENDESVETDRAEEEEKAADNAGVLPPNRTVVGDVLHPNVRGWAFDIGMTWLIPVTGEPRLTMAYAMGSGDGKRDNRTDRAFRQTGLHGNEPGYGGVQRFQGYGELLDPELSNLSIFTIGIGFSLFNASSVDLIYHDYRLVEYADSLRDARVDAELTGAHRDVGQGIDLVLGLEEWANMEFEFSASAFRAGNAFGADDGEWIYGSFVACRLAF